jgi:hypothetical protein
MRKKDTSLSDAVVWAGVSYEGSIVADADIEAYIIQFLETFQSFIFLGDN